MKKLLLLLPLSLLLAACSNDFEVAAPWKEIPVVYAILSPQDTAHYIRVEKAFIDPDNSALEVAQIADSLYYPENAITVWLERASNNTRVQLQRIDGALDGHPRTGGIFAGQPNWLYKVKSTPAFALQGGEKYRLVIERADGRPDVTSETTLPADFFVTEPDPSLLVPKINFASPLGTDIVWRTDVNGVYFNVTFKVRYRERYLNGTLAGTYELVWDPIKSHERNDLPQGGVYKAAVVIPRASFFGFLAKNIKKPAADRYREFESIDLIIDGGGKEIKEYLLTAAANSGLTGAETFPNYTNISEGFGIFTGKSQTIIEKLRVDVATVDTMNRNSVTDTLGFRY